MAITKNPLDYFENYPVDYREALNKFSHVGVISGFSYHLKGFDAWNGEDEKFAQILSRSLTLLSVYSCHNPKDESYSSQIMEKEYSEIWNNLVQLVRCHYFSDISPEESLPEMEVMFSIAFLESFSFARKMERDPEMLRKFTKYHLIDGSIEFDVNFADLAQEIVDNSDLLSRTYNTLCQIISERGIDQ